MLVFFGLVEQLSQRLKPGRGGGGDAVGAEGAPDDPWVMGMQERLTDLAAMLQVAGPAHLSPH
jgi:hypothetical protein